MQKLPISLSKQAILQEIFRKSLILLIFVAVFLLFSEAGLAHYLWVETPMQVEPGESYEYEVFWGHLTDDPSERSVTEVNVYLLEQPGLLSQLEYRNEEDYLQGKVEPEQSGVQQVFAVRPAGVYQLSLNQFTARAINVYGEAEGIDRISPAGLPLEINLLNTPEEIIEGEELNLQANYQGKPLAKADITMRSIANPEQEEILTTDQEGRIEEVDSPDEPVLFNIEHNKEISGEKDGYEYEEINLYHTLFLGL